MNIKFLNFYIGLCIIVVTWGLVGVIVYIDILEIGPRVTITEALITGFFSTGVLLGLIAIVFNIINMLLKSRNEKE